MAEPIKPARGVDLAQVLPVTAVLAALGAAVLVACVLYRQGRLPAVERGLARLEARTGLPSWSTVPGTVSGISLMTAGFGFYWDVAVHIDNGRDNSPFGTPAHWPIVLGLCGLVLAGILAVTLDRDTDGGAAIRLPGGLRCSLGAALVLLCGSISLLGFPLDDLWHNAFGQDVTLWSPTHIQMIGGASLTTLATWVLMEEGRRRAGSGHVVPTRALRVWHRLQPVSIAGAFLIGLSTLQAEFDYGVPQFSPAYHPILLSLAAAVGLVAARMKLGRGGALVAALFFVVVRGSWALVIHGAFGLSLPHEPLYLAEALLVEVAALAVGTRNPVRFGLLAGGLIGSVGLAVEWAWSQVAFPLSWSASLLPEALVLAFVTGLAGGVLGALTGRALLPPGEARERTPHLAAGLAFAAAVGVIAVVLPLGTHDGYRAAVDVQAVGDGTANLTVRVTPASAAEGAAWFNVTSWQGGQQTVPATNGFAITPLEKVSEGVYRTTRPVPVVGEWKTLIRLTSSTTSEAVPVYLPEDQAIPAEGVPALAHFERDFVPDVTILQREQVGGSQTAKHVAYGVLAFLAMLWLATLSLGLQRLDRAATGALRPLVLSIRRTPEGALA
jgi:hypothetical protein